MPRGRVWRAYVDNAGTTWAALVDADEAADANRGWAAVSPGTPALPAGSVTRRVFGRSAATGRPGTARLGTVGCALWAGSAHTFNVEATDGTLDTVTVTQWWPERIRRSK